ncbi:hypothetical protein L6164_016725 [Bauhinia variegata]|uniref:Uncharacterized protein n=1 Tax=Bauhinia variegata TaxID=167791 RepID=A0ACB9N586_BAUVA|nr:hypothetical protein L6164_016725 [Bauhinia variegata]
MQHVPLVINAALPPELYWKSMLPNTTMPKAVKDLLSAGSIGNAMIKDPNSPIFIWRRATTNQLHNDLNNPVFFWRSVTTNQLQDDPNNPIIFWQRARTNKLHDDPNNPIFFWRPVATDQLQDDPNNPIFFWQRATTDQLHDDPNNPIFFWRRATTDQLHDDPNNPIFFWQPLATTDQLHDNPNNPIFFWQPVATDQLQDDPNNPIFFWRRATTDQLHDDPNNPIFFWRRAITDQLHDNSNNPIFFWRHATTDQLHDNPNNPIFFWQRATTDQLHDDPNNPISVNQTLDDSSKILFFLENDLSPGKKLEMLFTKSPYSKILIPREVADAIPFSVEMLPEILKMFSVEPGSKEAQTIKTAIHHCEEPPRIKGAQKHCATSLESMVDYITSKLGKNVKAYSTEVEKETKLQTYTISPGVKKISDEVIACHQKHYPYALFHCHKVGNSNRAYFVPLEGSDGTRVKAIAVCHSDTSEWDPNHLALRTLKIKPGTAPVCHFSPADNIFWTAATAHEAI